MSQGVGVIFRFELGLAYSWRHAGGSMGRGTLMALEGTPGQFWLRLHIIL